MNKNIYSFLSFQPFNQFTRSSLGIVYRLPIFFFLLCLHSNARGAFFKEKTPIYKENGKPLRPLGDIKHADRTRLDADTSSIVGSVQDTAGKPLAGAAVLIQPGSRHVITNGKGKFILSGLPPNTYKLTIRFIGYTTLNRIVSLNATRLNLVCTLRVSAKELEGAVVVGYGVTKKRLKTEALSTVNAKELTENQASVSVSDMLAGRLPGLTALKTSGDPGSGSTLYVRGLGSFNNSSPLVVVDGIPDRNLDDLNANDIQEISVLKDAAAISVYGARAANGVILVTTKKGKLGKPLLSFSATAINQRPTQYYKLLNSAQYAEVRNEGMKNEGAYNPALGLGYSPEEVQKFKDGSDPDHYPNTNWVKDVMRQSIWQSNYNLSVSGGNELIRFFISGGYAKNNGVLPVEDYRRYNLRSSIDARIAKNLSLSLILSGSLARTGQEPVYGTNAIAQKTYNTPPTRVNRFSNGTYAYVPQQGGNAYLLSRGASGSDKTDNNSFNSVLNLQYAIPAIPGFSLKANAAYDKLYSFQKLFATPYDAYNIDNAGNYTLAPNYPIQPFLREYFSQSQSLTLEGGMQYDASFKMHTLSAFLLYTQTNTNTDQFTAQRNNFISSSLAELNLGDPTNSNTGGTGTRSARNGLVGRFGYNYKQKYLAQFNFRYDGSNIFPPGHKYGFFPSLALGWVISDEPFMKKLGKVLDFLKIRASWGQLGNDRVDPYQYLTTYTLSSPNDIYGNRGYSFGGSSPSYFPTLYPNVIPNPNFTWERATNTNIGVEAHVKRNLLTVEIDYFFKRTKDILAPPAENVTKVLGLGLPDFNNGIVDSKGLEIQLGHTNRIGKFTYSLSPNVSFNQNKIIYFPEPAGLPEWQKITGKSIAFNDMTPGRIFIGYLSDGLYQSKEEIAKGPTPLYPNVAPGDIKYKDVNKDGKISAEDQVFEGAKFFPKIQLGMHCSLSYKDFELNMLFQGAAKVHTNTYNTPGLRSIPADARQLDRWTPEHTQASYPRLWYQNQNNVQPSDYWNKSTAYVRLKNLELAYSIPASVAHHLKIRSLKFVLSGNNLLTFTKFKLYDPEGAGGSSITDPLLKSYSMGIQLQF